MDKKEPGTIILAGSAPRAIPAAVNSGGGSAHQAETPTSMQAASRIGIITLLDASCSRFVTLGEAAFGAPRPHTAPYARSRRTPRRRRRHRANGSTLPLGRARGRNVMT